MPTERRWPVYLATLVLVLPPVAATLLGFLAEKSWIFDALSHFRLQYALAFAVLASLYFLLRRPAGASVLLAFCALNLVLGLPWRLPPEAVEEAEGKHAYRMVSLNTEAANNAHETVRTFLEGTGADLIVLLEVTPELYKALAPLREKYAFKAWEPRSWTAGILVLSEFPLQDLGRIHPGNSTYCGIVSLVILPEGPVTLIAAHAPSPLGFMPWKLRNEALRRIGAIAAEAETPVIAAGDFNCTPFSPFLQRTLREGGIRPPLYGIDRLPTWPTTLPGLRVPIDHILFSKELVPVRYGRSQYVKSDHFPLLAEFVYPQEEVPEGLVPKEKATAE